MADKQIQCKDCGKDFVFTEGEQEFYNKQNPPFSDPVRCASCRRAKRERRGDRDNRY